MTSGDNSPAAAVPVTARPNTPHATTATFVLNIIINLYHKMAKDDSDPLKPAQRLLGYITVVTKTKQTLGTILFSGI